MTRDILAWRRRDAAKPPPLLEYRSSYLFTLVTISVAVFTDIFLYGIIVPVIPFALTSRVGVPEEDVQHWVSVLLAVYGASLLGASPVCGFLADHTPSRRLPLLIGLLALLGSTVLLCLGTTITLLVIGRFLQGLSAAIVWTVGLALMADTVGHESVGQAMGYVSMSMSVAILVAPMLGGAVYERVGYYSVFYMAFALIFFDVILRVVLVEKKIAQQWMPSAAPLTAPPSTSYSSSSVPPSTSYSTSSLPPWTLYSSSSVPPSTPYPSSSIPEDNEKPQGPATSSPAEPTPPATAISTSPSTISASKRPTPTIFRLLGSRRLIAALFCALVHSTLLTSWDAVLPLHVHALFGWSSTGGGLIFLPLVLPSFAAPLVGHWSDKRGPRVPTALGFLLAVPFLIAIRTVTHAGEAQIALLAGLLACLGVALTLAMTPLLAEVTYIVHVKEVFHPGIFGNRGAYATAYGLFNMAFAGGMLVGPIWGGFVMQASGFGTMGWTLAVLAAGGSVAAALQVGGWVGRKGARGQVAQV